MVRIIFIIYFFLLTGFSFGATPITIHSDRMEVIQNKEVVVFTGKVVAKKEDFILYADSLVVHYQSKNGKREIVKMVASGNVRFVKDNWIAHSGKAIYFREDEKILLEDNPSIWHGEDVVRGDKITFYLREDRGVVEGKLGHKVEAVVFSGD